jgi:CheY-like chemotaxis protein
MGVDVELVARQASEAYLRRGEEMPESVVPKLVRAVRHLGPLAYGRRVLWVDDHPEGNEQVAKLLRHIGVQLRQVKSSAEALRLLGNSDAPDLIVLDWGRAEGRDAGPQLVGRLRSDDMRMPLIFYTMNVRREQVEIARQLDAELTVDPAEVIGLALLALARSALAQEQVIRKG